MPTAAAIIACALTLLGKSERNTPPIVLVDTAPIEASVQVEAYVRPADNNIYIVTSSPMFRTLLASRSDCGEYFALKKLASIIAHEEWHIRHGGDERGAYQAQLTTLLRLGVSPDNSLYTSVVRSMLVVVKKQQEKPEMVLARQP